MEKLSSPSHLTRAKPENLALCASDPTHIRQDRTNQFTLNILMPNN